MKTKTKTKTWMGAMRGYWGRWNQVYRNQVSYEDDGVEIADTAPIDGTKVAVRSLEIGGGRQLPSSS